MFSHQDSSEKRLRSFFLAERLGWGFLDVVHKPHCDVVWCVYSSMIMTAIHSPPICNRTHMWCPLLACTSGSRRLRLFHDIPSWPIWTNAQVRGMCCCMIESVIVLYPLFSLLFVFSFFSPPPCSNVASLKKLLSIRLSIA